MITDFSTWLLDNDGAILQYEVYKRVFTPHEIHNKFSDQTEFADTDYNSGIIKEAIELPDGDILLGFLTIFGDEEEIPEEGSMVYYKLSEIRLYKFKLEE